MAKINVDYHLNMKSKDNNVNRCVVCNKRLWLYERGYLCDMCIKKHHVDYDKLIKRIKEYGTGAE